VDDVVDDLVAVVVEAIADLGRERVGASDRVVAVGATPQAPRRVALAACVRLEPIAVHVDAAERGEVAVLVVAFGVTDRAQRRGAGRVAVVAVGSERYAPVVEAGRVAHAVVVGIGCHVLAASPLLRARVDRALHSIVAERRLHDAAALDAALSVGAEEIVVAVVVGDARTRVAEGRRIPRRPGLALAAGVDGLGLGRAASRNGDGQENEGQARGGG
jgi:hypothetical protein